MRKLCNKGLTVVEMLTVLVVMAIIVSLLVPAVVKILDTAKTTKQKSQFAVLSIGIESFKNDMGYYPPSDNLPVGSTNYSQNGTGDYCGSQKLAEAMVGWDLFGFHPKSVFKANGDWTGDSTEDYDSDPTSGNLNQRKGPYIQTDNIDVILYADAGANQPGYLNSSGQGLSSNFVICDSFKKYNKNLNLKVGVPVLYFRAYSNRVEHDPAGNRNYEQIYDYMDNWKVIAEVSSSPVLTKNKFYEPYRPNESPATEGYIADKRVTIQDLPYNKDSFILISAGADGLYGTKDDVFNFEKE